MSCGVVYRQPGMAVIAEASSRHEVDRIKFLHTDGVYRWFYVLSRATQTATGAVAANGRGCLCWLSVQVRILAKAHETAQSIVRGRKEGGGVVRRIRALFKRTSCEKVTLDLNKVIGEVFRILRGDVATMRSVNAIGAIVPVVDRPNRLSVRSPRQSVDAVVVEIRDHGVGMGMSLAICWSIIDPLDARLRARVQSGMVQ
jgi:hypothetical protein